MEEHSRWIEGLQKLAKGDSDESLQVDEVDRTAAVGEELNRTALSDQVV